MQPQPPYGGSPQQPGSPASPASPPPAPLQPHQPADYVPGGSIQPSAPTNPAPGQLPNANPLPTYPAPSNANPNDYAFIMNPAKPTAKTSLFGGGSSKLILVVIALVIILLLVGAFALLGNRPNPNQQAFLSLSQQQAELIRISSIGSAENDASAKTRTTALTTNMTVSTDATNLNSYLSKNGTSFKSEQLALGADANASKRLDTSLSTSTFDSVFNEILVAKLEKYQASLQQTYNQVSGDSAKQVLSTSYDHAELLTKQAKQ